MPSCTDAKAGFPPVPAGESAADIVLKVRALSSPRTFNDGTTRVEPVETHFAWIFLTDKFAYKLKKPIRADRLDHTTLASRDRACREELRLNRRLAPSIYMSIVPLTRDTDGSIQLNGNGYVIDWLVKMHRLPQDLMLDQAMAAGAVNPNSLCAIGKLLAEFHAAQPALALSATDYSLRMRRRIDEFRAELLAPDLRLRAPFIEQLHAAQVEALDTVNEELRMRPARRGIIDAHGDLRPEHVFLGEPPCVIDALEFCDDLRMLDPIEDLAFLVVECAHAGHGQIGDAILDSYRACAADNFSPSLFDFYCSQRAANRAKIVAWRLRDPEVRSRYAWNVIAEAYVERALRHAVAALTRSGAADVKTGQEI